MLTAAGRRVRLVALAMAAALLLAGTLFGSDDHFPFGPFRMYSTADDPDGRVLSTTLRAVRADGRTVPVGEQDIGMRRAEYEGQLDRLVTRPEILGELAAVYQHRHPDRPRYVEIQIVRTTYQLTAGAPGAVTEQVLAVWREAR